MNGLVIRRMRAVDVDAVHLIDCMSLPLPWSRQSYLRELGEARSRLWVAEVTLHADGAPLEYRSSTETLTRQPGEMAVVGMLVMWRIVDEAHIATLAVHPQFRRGGIARRLMLVALENAAAEGAKYALLEVRASNLAAQELYRRLGFEVVGHRPRYYMNNNEDALLMNLEDLHRFRPIAEVGRPEGEQRDP